MRWIALSITVLFAALALFSTLRPQVLYEEVDSALSPGLIYGLAAGRVIYGLILMGAAASSKFPGVLKAIGIFLILAGIALVFIGVDGLHSIFDMMISDHDFAFIRTSAILGFLFFLFIIYVLIPHREGQAESLY